MSDILVSETMLRNLMQGSKDGVKRMERLLEEEDGPERHMEHMELAISAIEDSISEAESKLEEDGGTGNYVTITFPSELGMKLDAMKREDQTHADFIDEQLPR